jgi:hypothetical protein
MESLVLPFNFNSHLRLARVIVTRSSFQFQFQSPTRKGSSEAAYALALFLMGKRSFGCWHVADSRASVFSFTLLILGFVGDSKSMDIDEGTTFVKLMTILQNQPVSLVELTYASFDFDKISLLFCIERLRIQFQIRELYRFLSIVE